MKKNNYYILAIILQLYFLVSYIVNAVQFFMCDFDAPYKEEIIKGVGLLGLSFITVWL